MENENLMRRPNRENVDEEELVDIFKSNHINMFTALIQIRIKSHLFDADIVVT